MAHLYQELAPSTQYVDKKSGFTKEKWLEAIKTSRTLYVGNLSFFTTEEQIHELFSKCGDVKRVVMGLNRYKKSPCGFCFVEFVTHEQAAQAVNLLNKTTFDDRLIRVDWDAGLSEGRQYGRGESGDQWRDDFRNDFDVARGGAGRNLLRKIEGQPGKQVYVGKRKQDHGRFAGQQQQQQQQQPQDAEDPAAKRARFHGPGGNDWGSGSGIMGGMFPGYDAYGLPMSFGHHSGHGPTYGFHNSGKGKSKGSGAKSRGKGRDRDRNTEKRDRDHSGGHERRRHRDDR